jgi:tyrosine-protein phosphatase YwqE
MFIFLDKPSEGLLNFPAQIPYFNNSNLIKPQTMFSFFKKSEEKSKQNFSFIGTDIHSHLIPNIDDGCQDLQSSLTCLKHLQEMGFSKVVTTPHIMSGVYPNTPSIINEGLAVLRKALEAERIDIQVEAAAEYKIDELFVEYLAADNLLTFGDKYILIELSFVAVPINLEDIIFTLQTKGYKPILAHPERYRYWSDKLSQIERLKSLGCLMQLNMMSLVGQYGGLAKDVAHKLLNKNLIDFLGTDLHRPEDIDILKKLLKNKEEMNKLIKVKPMNVVL